MNKHKIQGLSLVELMISIVIASVIMIGVIQLTIASKSNFQFQEQMSSMQENARFALYEISKNVKNSHLLPNGCPKYPSVANMTWSNEINHSAVNYTGLGVEVIPMIQNKPVVYSKLKNAEIDSDALYLGLIDASEKLSIDTYSTSFNQFTLAQYYKLPKKKLMMMTDALCNQLTVFYAQAINIDDVLDLKNINVVDLNGVSAEKIKNCSNYLFGNFHCLNESGNSISGNGHNRGSASGATIYPIIQKYYYIADSTQKDQKGNPYPSLFLNHDELVQGIESMNIDSGMDLNSDGVIDQYVKSSTMNSVDWQYVKSLRVKLTVRSLEKMNHNTSSNSDGYLRQTYTQTIGLRNE